MRLLKLSSYWKLRARRLVGFSLISVGVLIFVLSVLGFYDIVVDRFDVYIVITGSMEPSIPIGSIVIIQKIEAYPINTLKVGDMVAYKIGDTVFIHRLIDFEGENRLVLKGDAVSQSEKVKRDQVIGKVIFGVPAGGYVLTLLPLLIFAFVISLGSRWG